MLDVLTYTKSDDGTWAKNVSRNETLTEIAAELTALQDQLAAFQQSQAAAPSSDVATAIINYQQQIAVLQAG